MRLSRTFATAALLAAAASALPLSALAQQAGGGGGNLRSWCKEGHVQMCKEAKADREAAKSACGGQQQGQANEACQQARAKFKSDVEAMHQAGAPRAQRGGRRGGGAEQSGEELGE